MIIVSVPGKIHLLGEHSVVYGFPALLVTVSKRLFVTVKLEKKQNDDIVIRTQYGERLIQQAISVFLKHAKIEKLPALTISVSSDIPVGSGMGSSAALAAGVIGALSKSIKNIWNPARINDLSYEVEKTAHGNPSGADNSVVVFGGLLWYRKEFDFLRSIWSLPIVQYTIPRFMLLDTGKPIESTKEMVSVVAVNYKKNKKKMIEIFYDQEIQTKKLLVSLKENNIQNMKSAIAKGERNLENMGVVGDFTKEVIRKIEEKGGVAKVCGAGGKKVRSGMVLCYHDDLSVIEKIADGCKTPLIQTIFGDEGIRIESTSTHHSL